jgi:glycine cleavage system transcriptional repressor
MADTGQQFVISITSRDRIGIVRDVSSAISELRGDIADLRQSVLCGYFTMILIAAFPAEVAAETIRERLAAINTPDRPALEITVNRAEGLAADEAGALENAYVLTASGPDRIGFVATVSSFCARHQINILDLSTAVADGSYIMMLLVDLSRCDTGDIRRRLKQFGQETGFNVVLQHYDIFKATHEVGVL